MKKTFIRNGAAMSAVSGAFLWACSAVFSSVHAALPKVPVPTGGGIGGAAVQEGDWMAMMGAYFKQGLNMLGLLLAVIACLAIVIGALQNYKAYTEGRMSLGDLKQYLIVGVVVIVFIIALVQYADGVLA